MKRIVFLMIKYQFIKSFGFLVTLIKNEKIIIKFYKNNKILSHWVFGCFWSLSVKLEKDCFPEEKVVGHQFILLVPQEMLVHTDFICRLAWPRLG